jgi:ankyrin repeat protein
MVACSAGSDKIASVLINAGADTNVKDGGGNTPIHYAAKSGSVPLMKVLLEKTSANLKTKNNIGMTPIDLAPNKEAKKYLLKS